MYIGQMKNGEKFLWKQMSFLSAYLLSGSLKAWKQIDRREISRAGKKHGFSEEKTQELFESFSLFDKNGDGIITTEELGTVMMSMGQRPTRLELRALIHSVDGDQSGTIDFGEFLEIFAKKIAVDPEKELQEVFSVFDQNKDGFISSAELYEVLFKLGVHITKVEAEEMVKEADLNGDGKVDYKEFEAILKWK